MQRRSIISRELSLFKSNVLARLCFPSAAQQQYFVLPDILPSEEFEALKTILMAQKEQLFRQHSFFRKGAALDAVGLRAAPYRPLLASLVQDSLLVSVRTRTQLAELQYVPAEDSNLISLLYYGNEGDGIDWHVDGNIYLGDRWAGILTFQERTNDPASKLELEIRGDRKTFDVAEVENSLILFRGDHIRHRVRAMNAGEERLVVNLLFTTNPAHTRNPILRGYQSMVNYFFYGKLKPSL